jgi:AcrR family transcriptional regulator
MRDATSSLRERKKQRTHEQLARATVDLVAARGLAGVRVEDICAQVEVGRATFFRYFDSKERAFVEGVHEGRLRLVLDELARRPPEEAPFDALRHAFLATLAGWRDVRDNLLSRRASGRRRPR